MSTFTYPVRLANPRGDGDPVEVKLLVHNGAMFTCLPRPQLEASDSSIPVGGPVAPADGRREEWPATETS